VLAIPAGIRLARMLGDVPSTADLIGARFNRALDLARVLAHVTDETSAHPMRDAGWPTFPGSRREGELDRGPRLSESRFRRLLQSENGEEMVMQFVRLIALLDRRANVGALSDAFRWWDHPEGRAKQRWAFEYYNAGAATRPTNDSPEDHAE
jgi:hypothetical protein